MHHHSSWIFKRFLDMELAMLTNIDNARNIDCHRQRLLSNEDKLYSNGTCEKRTVFGYRLLRSHSRTLHSLSPLVDADSGTVSPRSLVCPVARPSTSTRTTATQRRPRMYVDRRPAFAARDPEKTTMGSASRRDESCLS